MTNIEEEDRGTVCIGCEASSIDRTRTGVIKIMEKIQDEKQLERIYRLAEYLYLYEA